MSTSTESDRRLTPSLLLLMAVACAIGLANNYYCQPLLVAMARNLHASDAAIGTLPTLTQVGMAFGIILVTPLGDRYERRKLVVATSLACSTSLLVFALAPNITVLQIASAAVGLTSVVSTLVLPFAVSLAEPSQRGKTVGTIASSMLLGILLSRTISGSVGEHFGWRTMFFLASGMMATLALVLRIALPTSRPTANALPYAKLLASMVQLAREHRSLREATTSGILLYGSLTAFWASLAFFCESPAYGFGPSTIGLFGFVGAAGAMSAPFAGRLADRMNPRQLVFISALLMLLSYGIMAAFGTQLWGLIAGILLLDAACQAATVSNQATVYSLPSEVHSRAYTVYRASFSLGGAAGAYLGVWGWSQGGWMGVCAVGTGLITSALAAHFLFQSGFSLARLPFFARIRKVRTVEAELPVTEGVG